MTAAHGQFGIEAYYNDKDLRRSVDRHPCQRTSDTNIHQTSKSKERKTAVQAGIPRQVLAIEFPLFRAFKDKPDELQQELDLSQSGCGMWRSSRLIERRIRACDSRHATLLYGIVIS